MTTPEGSDDKLETGEGDPLFAEFLRRVRAGDERAEVEFVRRYEPVLRLEIGLRLTDPKLRRLLEPDDFCQSVLKSFFVRAASGQYDLDSPAELLALLRAMARNKVTKQARKRRTLRRDVSLDNGAPPQAAAGPSPSRVAIGREILDALRGRLTAEERRLADLRSQGREWAEITRELGGNPQARRKQLARAVDRAARELRLDGGPDGCGPGADGHHPGRGPFGAPGPAARHDARGLSHRPDPLPDPLDPPGERLADGPPGPEPRGPRGVSPSISPAADTGRPRPFDR
jgi:RNA polymerase sigma-70 factor (ECF subfamily)